MSQGLPLRMRISLRSTTPTWTAPARAGSYFRRRQGETMTHRGCRATQGRDHGGDPLSNETHPYSSKQETNR